MLRIAAPRCLELLPGAMFADQAGASFDGGAGRKIRLTFEESNWYNTLYQAHSGNTGDPYSPARFPYGSIVIDRIGVRSKGNSAFRRNGVKKPFKLDFNKYDDAADFLALRKLNLNNGDLQPDLMREKLRRDFAGRYVAALQSVHVRLCVNNVGPLPKEPSGEGEVDMKVRIDGRRANRVTASIQ